MSVYQKENNSLNYMSFLFKLRIILEGGIFEKIQKFQDRDSFC